ncbi:MAG: hypothetical protein KKD39_03280, partial [Candidatus Altiarchaeota archaeon]|nr:hypothetical protein [Candidatus Altiarchaeota archaeon]
MRKTAIFFSILFLALSVCASPCPPNARDCVDCAGVACTSNCLPGEGKKEADGRITAYEWLLEDAGTCKCYCPWRPQSSTPTTSKVLTTSRPTTTEKPYVPEGGNSKCDPSIGENCRTSSDCTCLSGQTCDPKNPKAQANGCVSAYDSVVCPENAVAYGTQCVCREGYMWNQDKTSCIKKGNEVCDNKFDDDGDKLIDCEDSDCEGHPNCREMCDNKKDDDLDGFIDCIDLEDCADDPDCREICDNGVDDTSDGKADCEDPACALALNCRPELPAKLDLFIMSECPFGTEALFALYDVSHHFDETIDIRV